MQRFILDFFKNPAGSGASFLNIKTQIAAFDEKYAKVSEKIIGSYCIDKGTIYIGVKIPSSVEGVYYDSVVKFSKTMRSSGNGFADYEIHLFSNCPSFIYTFAYAYLKNGLLIKELRSKLNSQILKDPAASKNSYNVVSYDFSIYAALKYIIENKYLSADALSSLTQHKSFKEFVNSIQHADHLAKFRYETKTANDLAKKNEEKEREKVMKSSKLPTDDQSNEHTGKVKTVKSVNSVKSVKKSKRV